MNADNYFTLAGTRIFVLPDNNEKFDNIPLNSVGMNGDRLIVRESEWPALREMLIAATKEKA